MFYYKINNLIKENNNLDYKGLNLDLIQGGTQVYPKDLIKDNMCLIGSTEDIKSNRDLEQITEEEYLQLKAQIEEENKIDIQQGQTLEEKIKMLTENLAQEKVSNMKKDALAMNLTKEVANLKIEVMNLKKGGN